MAKAAREKRKEKVIDEKQIHYNYIDNINKD
jgi:hypothetical protein